jgi:CheY-like chemotaxis protein
MSGIEFVEGVSKVPVLAKIPLYMVTTESTDSKVAEAKAKHPQLAGYITKPFTEEQLREAILPHVK